MIRALPRGTIYIFSDMADRKTADGIVPSNVLKLSAVVWRGIYILSLRYQMQIVKKKIVVIR